MVIFFKNEGIQTFLSIQLFPQVYALAPPRGVMHALPTHTRLLL